MLTISKLVGDDFILKSRLLFCSSLLCITNKEYGSGCSVSLNQILKQLISMFASRVSGAVNVIKNLLDWILRTLVNVGNS